MFDKISEHVLKRISNTLEKNEELRDATYPYWYDSMGRKLTDALKAYTYSGDEVYLKEFVKLMQHVLSKRYIHPEQPELWRGWWDITRREPVNFLERMFNPPNYSISHAAEVYYVPALMFVEMVRADPKLKPEYGALAEEWLKDIEELEMPSWDKQGRWKDLGERGGVYNTGMAYPDPRTHEIVGRLSDEHSTLTYRSLAPVVNALARLHRLTGKPIYRQKLTKLATWFRSNWMVEGQYVSWYARNHAGPWDFASGEFGKGKPKNVLRFAPEGPQNLPCVEFAVTCYNAGAVFTREDMEKLLWTNLRFMWMKDREKPRFRMLTGEFLSRQFPFDKPWMPNWGEGNLWWPLAQFDEDVRQLWLALTGNYRLRSTYALNYLLTTRRPVSWEPRPAMW
jgi:hypothetical protein